ncbi:thiF family protein [Desulfovibrio sp. A2]|nr:thiF family protein [Desulfovibrio sp. A2]
MTPPGDPASSDFPGCCPSALPDRTSDVRAAVLRASVDAPLPDGAPCRRLPHDATPRIARATGARLRDVEATACDAGIMPERYIRNHAFFSPAEQARLLRATVLLVGLGGLGGHVLDMLARAGVGRIVGVDGDVFEAGNLNRQLLSAEARLGMPKAEAAALHVAAVNGAVEFAGVASFVDAAGLDGLCAGRVPVRAGDEPAAADGGRADDAAGACRNLPLPDLVVDALGGLASRMALHGAAARAGLPLVTAAVAGLTGLVATVQPGSMSPYELLGAGGAAEDGLGTPAPAVACAASMQTSEALRLLAGRPPLDGVLLFDLSDGTFQRVRL